MQTMCKSKWFVPLFSVALLLMALLLAIYIVWSGDPIGYVILVLVGLFAVLPALILYLGNRRAGGMVRTGEAEEPDDRDQLDGNRSEHVRPPEDVHGL